MLLLVWGEHTGGNRFHTKAIESNEHVRVAQPAALRMSVSEALRAWLDKPGWLRPLPSGPSSAWSWHSPSASLRGRQRAGLRSWIFASCQRSISMLRRDKAQLGLGLPPPGATLASSPPGSEGSSGNLGHIAGPGPQDYLGIRRSKL